MLEPRRGGYGIALLSQSPLRRAEIVDLAGMPAVDVELVHGGQTLRLLGVHLRSPPGAARFAQRRQQYSGLTELLQARPQPTIVTGDFNTTPFSPLLTDWLRDNRVRDAARGRGYLYTWPTFLPILGIPIDHCFVTQEFQVLAHDRLPAIGSDHYPLLTRLSLTNGH
jgi:endonuclease/exonuclease/phosphatase (EEP) superfamily protein YafD